MLPAEHAAAGLVTSRAYREFAPPGDAGWAAYLEEIADVSGRAANSLVLVALIGTVVAGSATLELPDSGPAHMRMVGVDPSRRRQGVGKALVAGCIDTARRSGHEALTLHTIDTMTAAQALYESMGFERVEDEQVDGMLLLSYRLDLSGYRD